MKIQEGGIKKLILLGSTVLIITITIVVSLFLITTENKNFNIETQRIEEELFETRKQNIENRLKSLLNELNFDQALMKELQLKEVKSFVHTLYVGLTNYENQNKETTLGSILNAYDRNDTMHGFAFYEDGTVLWNPRNPTSQNSNILNAQDIHNQYYVKNMINTAKSLKESSITFTWYIPNKTTISTNIAYVKYIPKLNLIVGAYRSAEDINRWMKTTILKKISRHKFGKKSLFFIEYIKSYNMQENFSKQLLYLGNPNYLESIKLPHTQKDIRKNFLKKGFSGYHHQTFSHNNEQYLLYTTILPKWRWIIGLGENLQELTNIKNAQLTRARTNRDIKIMRLSVLSILIASIFFLLSKYLAQAIEKLLLNYRQKANMEADKYQALYQHSNDSFLIAKEVGLKIVDANPKALSLTLFSQEEMKNISLECFFPSLDFKKIKNQKSGYERTEFIDKKNNISIVEFTFVWIVLQNQKVIFVSIRDITERMKLVNERIQQEQLLIQQSKMAAMGEMLGNIAHQWRQPLSQLSGLFMDLDSAYTFGELNRKYMNKSVNEANDIIEYMSRTIDDFRNFFNPNKRKENFFLNEALNQAVKIILSSLESHNISLHVEIKDELSLYGYENEYAQVILNLLSNAKDILIERKIVNPKIDVTIYAKDNKTCLSIHDNAGGIDENIKTKIFEPYFTTKYDYGTGIGLYMSKVIIEKNMSGHITVENIHEGAKFNICI